MEYSYPDVSPARIKLNSKRTLHVELTRYNVSGRLDDHYAAYESVSFPRYTISPAIQMCPNA